MLLVIPMLAVVQAIAAEVGASARTGLARCVRTTYGAAWAYLVLAAVLIVNIVTLAADLEGGAAALQLVTHVDYRAWVVPFAAGVAALLVFGRYDETERWLRFIPLVFVAYVIAGFLARPDWGAVIASSLIPHFELRPDYVAGAIALLGTTLTAYAYVWETVEVAKERPPLRRLGLVQAEAALGIVAAGLTFWFIVISTGATLGVHHKSVETAQDAAQALAPFAGPYASLLFAVGLFGSALIAVPVIAGTSAYVIAETFGWRRNLDEPFGRARKFYVALLLALASATVLALTGIPPIKLLLISSIAGGIATPLTLAFLMLVASRADVMRGGAVLRGPLRAAGWTVTAIVAACGATYLVQLARGGG